MTLAKCISGMIRKPQKKETPNMRRFTEQVGYIEIAVLCLVQIRIFNQETGMSLFHSLLCLRQ